MFIAVTCGAAFALGAVLGGAFARDRRYAVYFAGLVAGAGFVLAMYLWSAPDAQHDTSCSHCEQLWGRYWEPEFTFFLAGIGFLCYLAGAGIGAAVRGLWSLRR